MSRQNGVIMAFIDFKFYSEALGMQAEAYIVIPQNQTSGQIGLDGKTAGGKYKCLYLLHGLTDDHTVWMRRTSIERYAAKYGICVVMPCAHRSFYCNIKNGSNYYDYIANELPRIVCEFFNVSSRREDNFIAGNSMGGYGALKIAMRNPDRFCAAAGLSSVTDISAPWERSIMNAIFGEGQPIPANDDLYYLSEKCAEMPCRPRIFMAVGTEDWLYQDSVKLRERLISLGYAPEYVEERGEHNWDFWDKHIQTALEFLTKSN